MCKAIVKILDGCQTLDIGDDEFEKEELHEYKPAIRFIHKYIVKPISYWGSSRILKKKLIESVGDVTNKVVFDVSCGDDEMVLGLTDKAKKVIASDISMTAMAPLMEKAKDVPNLEFQVNNLVELTGKYDVVVCKNTLHHMNTTVNYERALRVLKSIGKKIVIMDIENPRLEFLSRLWNNYYRIALKDQGAFFVSFEQFIQAVRVVFLTKDIVFKKVKTIKGNYMLAIINQ